MCVAWMCVLSAPLAWAGPPGDEDESEEAAAPGNVVQAGFTLEPDGAPYASFLVPESVDSPQAVDLDMLAMPGVVGGDLHHYYFVSVRLMVTEGVDPWVVRGKAHRLRDAIVEVSHNKSVMTDDGTELFDLQMARSIIREAAGKVVDPAAIDQVDFTRIAVRQ